MSESLRLFVIEDDPDSALLIRRHLERAGHTVTTCRSGTDALLVLGHTAYDLVLLGSRLPDMGGLDFLHSLAHEDISVPVLMVTQDQDAETARQVFRAGAVDYIVKDTALTFLGELPKRVREAVTRHRLEQSNRLLIQALESARDGIMITDLQGVILKVNQALESLTGYSREELLGQTPRLLKSAAHGSELFARMWQTILARRSWQGELTNRRKDGSLFPVSLTISPIIDGQGRMTHFVGIQRDISEHKQLERALLQAQKMQSVGTLAGGVAHEFNNLLAGINGYAALGLRERDIGPTLREFLQRIEALSERAAGLTRQLLAFARKPALTRQRTPMVDLVRNTVELVRRTLYQDVVVELPNDEKEHRALIVEADANQLQQAMVNLALNARDSLLPETGRPIVFRLRSAVFAQEQAAFPQQVPPGDYVIVEVEDHGSGMTANVLNQALDPFFTTKEVGQGTGLGLPMVFGIVQGHQGYLTIDSAPGRGTRVGLYLPRALPRVDAATTAPPPSDAEDVKPETTRSYSILVIDDEEAVLDVVRRVLEIAGHEVACVSCGADALAHLNAGRPCDLIILDLMMPREDAVGLFQRVRQRRPAVPVLLCTGLPQADPAPELLRCGAVGLIRKPFRMNELWSAVEQALVAA
ncbi:MAG TPA: response regulator [Gemmataceae bacterium]|nr:response regulator [Gemmataceae bacterium]